MSDISIAELEGITSFPKLVGLLRDKLDWPLGDDCGFEDVVYEYDANELGLKAEETAKLREIHQLRPLTTGQPWGIFFLSFEEKRISVTVLRRMLRSLIVKKRQSAQSANHQSWQLHDLIFVTSFGLSGARELAIAHFADGEDTGDLPTLNVLGWNRQDTRLHNEYVAEMLENRLRWPDDPEDLNRWREQWGSAFEIGHGQVIETSKDLAVRLAALAGNIRTRANELLAAETEKGRLRQMLAAFRKNLIQDLDEDGFADMFAQTIAYGLLAAHISRPSGGLVVDNLVDMVPKTNPFLRELFGTFLSLGGRDKRQAMDFDELGVRDVVDMLRNAKMEAVLRDFGDRNPKEDPVIHFYEHFLKAYDPKKRMQRGVFYTPRPVVNFIVRGVDEVLREEFGLPLGLADTTTWGELATRNDKIRVPDHIAPETPFVQILDPATGTGTFLVEVIDLIHKRMIKHWKTEGIREGEIKTAWNAYVPEHLLPRMTGFELMMAPYAIAHMKIGLKLVETGYNFGSDERAQVLLTNALSSSKELDLVDFAESKALADEAEVANVAKEKTTFTVIIGNPPYSLQSANLDQEHRNLVDKYKYIGDLRIKEKGALQLEKNLNDDYVKFFSASQKHSANSPLRILSLITNHSYLDNPTLRGMRWSLMTSYNSMRILDLHGNATKKEKPPQGKNDVNVFEIKQGVAICLMWNSGSTPRSFLHNDVWGSRTQKERFLLEEYARSCSGARTFEASAPLFEFRPINERGRTEFYHHSALPDICAVHGAGFISARDAFVIDMDRQSLVDRITAFSKSDLDDQEILEAFQVSAKKGWDVKSARRKLGDVTISNTIRRIRYRPFDDRWMFYDSSLVWGCSWPTAQHIIGRENLSILATRITKDQWDLNVCDLMASHKAMSAYDTNVVFPLFCTEEQMGGESRRPNIDSKFAQDFGSHIALTYIDGVPGSEQTGIGADYRREKSEQASLLGQPWDGRGDLTTTFGPRDLFDWIYGALHSPGYRSRYSEFLKSDFPRIPMPNGRAIFSEVVVLGAKLIALHLLRPDEAPVLAVPEVTFHGTGEARVAKGFPKFENGKVMINPTRWFEDVLRPTWGFHIGGYQVCQKWLKDRAAKGGKHPTEGRVLTDEDILHYRRIVVALTETRRLMAGIEKVVDQHGGWPDAFYVPPPPPPTIEEIIQADESRELEFKSTFQWDVREGKQNKELQKSVLKTLTAFMNSDGGTLAIGVTDDKEIHGLDDDLKLTKQSLDVFEQTFMNVFGNTIGTAFARYCPVRFADTTDGRKVCVIEVTTSSQPVFLTFQGKQEFFIRRGNASVALNASEQHSYIQMHFS
jgi:hypothetical protein